MKAPPRILLADDHELIRQGLRALIEAQGRWEICAEATTGREAVELAAKHRPQIVVMDITMPELNGLEATRQIRTALPNTEVLILTMHDSEELAREVLAAGARAFVLKSDAGSLLVHALDHLGRGEPFFSSKVARVLLNGFLKPAEVTSVTLTAREREIVQLIGEGKSSKEIAGLLGISAKTADTHRANLMRKLELHTVSDVVRYAVRNHLIQP